MVRSKLFYGFLSGADFTQQVTEKNLKQNGWAPPRVALFIDIILVNATKILLIFLFILLNLILYTMNVYKFILVCDHCIQDFKPTKPYHVFEIYKIHSKTPF